MRIQVLLGDADSGLTGEGADSGLTGDVGLPRWLPTPGGSLAQLEDAERAASPGSSRPTEVKDHSSEGEDEWGGLVGSSRPAAQQGSSPTQASVSVSGSVGVSASACGVLQLCAVGGVGAREERLPRGVSKHCWRHRVVRGEVEGGLTAPQRAGHPLPASRAAQPLVGVRGALLVQHQPRHRGGRHHCVSRALQSELPRHRHPQSALVRLQTAAAVKGDEATTSREQRGCGGVRV